MVRTVDRSRLFCRCTSTGNAPIGPRFRGWAGDAGMVTTHSDELAERVKMLRQHGMSRRYYHDEIGWNARMDGFQGAILSVKLKYIEGWNQARRTLAKRYHALFRAAGLVESGPYPIHGIVLPGEVPGSHRVWHQYVLRTARR